MINLSGGAILNVLSLSDLQGNCVGRWSLMFAAVDDAVSIGETRAHDSNTGSGDTDSEDDTRARWQIPAHLVMLPWKRGMGARTKHILEDLCVERECLMLECVSLVGLVIAGVVSQTDTDRGDFVVVEVIDLPSAWVDTEMGEEGR